MKLTIPKTNGESWSLRESNSQHPRYERGTLTN